MIKINEKLLVRTVEYTDLEIMHKWANNEARGDFQDWELISLHDYEEKFRKGFNSPQFKIFMVEYEGNNTGLVYINFRYTGNDVKVATLGLVLCNSEMRNKGIGKLVLRAVVDYLFKNYPVFRIEADTHVDNKGAKRVLEGSGFIFEGVLRGLRYCNGEYCDQAVYSILKNEWSKKNKGS